jgi:branched-chain amino acid transport system permease protein
MADILSVFVIGISYGLVLFLLASGMTLTMGLMRIVNMSHGALYMVAAFLGVWVVKETNNWVLGLVAGAVVAGLLGLLIEVGFLRRLYKQEADQVLLTIGLIYIFTNVAQWIWGTYPQSSPVPGLLSGSVQVGSVDLPVFRFFIVGFGLVMAILLWVFQDKTKIGARVRAGMDNREVAGSLGINLKVLFTGIFALGSLVAGLAGLVGGSLTGIHLGIGWEVLLFSLIVVVIGGTGSIQGALLGGVLIGLLNSFGTAYFPGFASYIIYVALIVILLVRPSGLLGRKMETDRPVQNLEKATGVKRRVWGGLQKTDSAIVDPSSWQARLHRWAPYIFVLVVLVVLPPFVGTYTQSIITKVIIFALFAMSLDVVMGYTGLISFGHAAFFGLGGYAVGILTVHYGISSFWLVLLITLVASAVLAAAIGYFSLRVSGIYFLLVTMAFGQLLFVVATKWYSLTGGTDGLVGISRPDLGFSIGGWTSLKYLYFVLIVFVICYVLLHRIVRSSFGRALVGVRENEGRMRSLGYNTWSLKYVGIIIAGVFGGVAGLLFAYFYGTMVPSYFALETSALPMLMVIMGGAATLWGPAVGAMVIILVQQYAGIYMPDRWPLILGAIFVLCVMIVRGGFARYLSSIWAEVRFGRAVRADLPESAGAQAATEEVES